MFGIGIGVSISKMGSKGSSAIGTPTAAFIDDGLVLWLDGRDPATMTLATSRVDEWRDKQGGLNKLATSSAGTGFNPAYLATYFNNQGGVNFNSDILESPAAFTDMNWETGFTVLAVVEKTARAGNYFSASLGQQGILGFGYGERISSGSAAGNAAFGVSRNVSTIIGSRYNGAWKFFRNDESFDLAHGTNQVGTGNFSKLSLGGWVGVNTANHRTASYFFYNKPLTDTQITQMQLWMMNEFSVPAIPDNGFNIVVDGNSLAVGTAGTTSATIHDGIIEANGPIVGTDYENWSIGGATTVSLESDASTRIDSRLRTVPDTSKQILIIWELGNDIGLNATRTGLEAYNNIKTYCQARKAAGWSNIIVGTCLPRKASATVNANYETERLACNTLIRDALTNSETWLDAIADYGGSATIGATGAADVTTYYNADGIHLNNTGHIQGKAITTAAINLITGL